MSLPNRIEIDPYNYQNKRDFQEDVARTVNLLGDLKYNCSIIYDCESVAIIEFDHADKKSQNSIPHGLPKQNWKASTKSR